MLDCGMMETGIVLWKIFGLGRKAFYHSTGSKTAREGPKTGKHSPWPEKLAYNRAFLQMRRAGVSFNGKTGLWIFSRNKNV